MARPRRALVLAGAALAAVPAVAAAAPTAPVISAQPEVVSGANRQITWSSAAFDPLSSGQQYVLTATPSTGTTQTQTLGAGVTQATINLANGVTYNVTVTASDIPCQDAAPVDPCVLTGDETNRVGTASNTVTFRVDNTAPTAALSINGGAAWTNDEAVLTGLTATDGPAPGTAMRMLLGESAGAVACGVPLSCGVPFAANAPFTLTGADGLKTVHARVVDALGNQSGVVSDTIGLDTTRPEMWGSTDDGKLHVDAGSVISFITKQADDIGGSGMVESSIRWTFCAGCATGATGRSPSKRFDTVGDYQITVWGKDVAGNEGSDTFTLHVEPPTPGSTGGSSGGGGTTAGGSGGGGGGTTTTGGGATTGRVVQSARLLGTARVGQRMRVQVRVAKTTKVRVAILQRRGTRTVLLRGFPARTVVANRNVVLTLPAPTKAGVRILRITAAGQTRTLTITVRK